MTHLKFKKKVQYEVNYKNQGRMFPSTEQIYFTIWLKHGKKGDRVVCDNPYFTPIESYLETNLPGLRFIGMVKT